MEKLSKSDLLKVAEEQRVKLSRYESRLRDVVTAYKSLSKEKEALEASLIALTASQAKGAKESLVEVGNSINSDESSDGNAEAAAEGSKENIPATEGTQNTDNEVEDTPSEQLRLQLATLTNSLSTLSAEKSKMEAGFQADKKKLRQEKEERERVIQDLQKQIKELEKQHRTELETIKSKLIVERHEREREHTDHGAMILELQKLTTEERNAKEQLETTISELRARALAADASEKRLGDAHNEMAVMKAKLRQNEETSPLLLQLQAEMSQLKQQHTVAIQEEQRRAKEAEDRARHLAAVHEERVANLESHLAELSESVGSYDRVRQQDQLAIQKLKDHIAQLSITPTPNVVEHEKDEASVELDSVSSVQNILKNISKLKEQLVVTNRLSEKPIDIEDAIFSLFMDFGNRQTELHAACREEREKLLQELEQAKSTKVHSPLFHARPREETVTEALRIQIRSLQERVRMLNTQLEQVECSEQEWKAQATRYQQQLETEKAAWREKVLNLEGELRARAIQTEQQLTKQREQSLALLEDKEQEIRTLKSSFQMFLPLGKNNEASSSVEEASENQLQTSELLDAASSRNTSDQALSGTLPGILLGTLQSETDMSSVGPADSPHILHYAHELARREVDISNLRKARNKLENTLRDTTKILAAERERHSEETLRLRESVARLERCQSREGANLEYLKNVVLSFLEPSSAGSKQHMLNAIGSVLRFSEDELDRVRHHSSNSWWYNAS
ncbi:GRIP and coiled-coil domain-containing protein 1 [Thrips palmi]|uniref:GRIP and coiled-coil domain-containing protein 1 n=1 Tax=Thrips palmi TaxID=161013 RepID=A0A6P9A7U7_THRPL|nr:GRIP and coiled-coil domain-containing protein 1 [Thrips palmi]XP_034253389.1 GRIP and coiled-coil domain-containing protein 1 [Thrips palmi]